MNTSSLRMVSGPKGVNDPQEISDHKEVSGSGRLNSPKGIVQEIQQLAQERGLNESSTNHYIAWILRFIRFNDKRPVTELSKNDLEKYLSYLAKELNYDFAAQESACRALRFLFEEFLKLNLGDLQFLRLKQRRGFFSRFGEQDCQRVISRMSGQSQLMAKLGVATNLKLIDIINIRLGDLDLKQNKLVVRLSNGEKKYTVNVPVHLSLELRIQSMKVKRLVQIEKEMHSFNATSELSVLANHLEPEWQYLFPSTFIKSGQKIKSRLNQTSLANFKADINFAIKKVNRSNLITPVKLATSKSKTTEQFYNSANQSLNRKNHIKQTAFDFSDNRGAA